MFCQNCGTKAATPSQRFCQECGGELNQTETRQPASAAPIEPGWSTAPGTTGWNGGRVPFSMMGSPVYVQAMHVHAQHHPLRTLLIVMAAILLIPFVALPLLFGSLFAGFALLHFISHVIPTVLVIMAIYWVLTGRRRAMHL